VHCGGLEPWTSFGDQDAAGDVEGDMVGDPDGNPSITLGLGITLSSVGVLVDGVHATKARLTASVSITRFMADPLIIGVV
jgi:hypothetical protein